MTPSEPPTEPTPEPFQLPLPSSPPGAAQVLRTPGRPRRSIHRRAGRTRTDRLEIAPEAFEPATGRSARRGPGRVVDSAFSGYSHPERHPDPHPQPSESHSSCHSQRLEAREVASLPPAPGLLRGLSRPLGPDAERILDPLSAHDRLAGLSEVVVAVLATIVFGVSWAAIELDATSARRVSALPHSSLQSLEYAPSVDGPNVAAASSSTSDGRAVSARGLSDETMGVVVDTYTTEDYAVEYALGWTSSHALGSTPGPALGEAARETTTRHLIPEVIPEVTPEIIPDAIPPDADRANGEDRWTRRNEALYAAVRESSIP